MVSPGHDRDVAVHSNFQVQHFGHIDVNRSVRGVADVSGFTVGVAVFHRDDKVVRQHGRQHVDLPVLVGLGPLFFEVADRGSAVGFLLRGRTGKKAGKQGQHQGQTHANAHGSMSHNSEGPDKFLVWNAVDIEPPPRYPAAPSA